MAWHGEPATERRRRRAVAGDGAADDGASAAPRLETAPRPRHGWASAVEQRATRLWYGVNVHVGRLNEANGGGDGVFAWK